MHPSFVLYYLDNLFSSLSLWEIRLCQRKLPDLIHLLSVSPHSATGISHSVPPFLHFLLRLGIILELDKDISLELRLWHGMEGGGDFMIAITNVFKHFVCFCDDERFH